MPRPSSVAKVAYAPMASQRTLRLEPSELGSSLPRARQPITAFAVISCLLEGAAANSTGYLLLAVLVVGIKLLMLFTA